MELAVNIPEHEPQVGQAERSYSSTSASLALGSAARIMASIRSTALTALPLLDLARLHRPAGDKDDRDVQAQRGHQHSRRDLVAVGDADQRIGAVGIDHVLDRIGDQLARGQAVEHAVVAHGDAVVDGDGVELLGHAAGARNLPRDQLAQVLQVDVTGNKLGKGVGDGDDGLAEVAVLHTGGAPKTARSGHIASVRRGS